MILGVFPSITATAEFVVPKKSLMSKQYIKREHHHKPKSMPMTAPLTFSSAPSA
jgi:hypothetical protein